MLVLFAIAFAAVGRGEQVFQHRHLIIATIYLV